MRYDIAGRHVKGLGGGERQSHEPRAARHPRWRPVEEGMLGARAPSIGAPALFPSMASFGLQN